MMRSMRSGGIQVTDAAITSTGLLLSGSLQSPTRCGIAQWMIHDRIKRMLRITF